MKPLKLTPQEEQVIRLLCELGETKLVAHRLRIEPKTVHEYIRRAIARNGHINRLTLALAWDRLHRNKGEE